VLRVPAGSGGAVTAVLRRLYAAARRAFVREDRQTLDWLDFERGRIVRLTDRAVREALRRRTVAADAAGERT